MNIPAKDPDAVSIIQITDTHIAPASDNYTGMDTRQSLQAVIRQINRQEQAPDLILLTGDLAYDPDIRAYQILTELLSQLAAPIYCIPGNHDDPDMLIANMQGKNIHTDKLLHTGNWSIILLNTVQAGTHAGYLSQTELDFLHTSLKTQTQEHTLIALHHHPLPCGSKWMDEMMLQNPQALLSIVSAFPAVKALICGHIHQEFSHRDGAVLYLASPSTCTQFKPISEDYT
ncbi:MAG: phosphodiesterase, partial [Gammaproteobacteria bacterium]